MKDVLGHPIRKGDTVLTAPYRSPRMTITTKVKKVTKKKVHVELDAVEWEASGGFNGVPEGWKRITVKKIVPRNSYQVVVVDDQIRNNKRKFPELQI